MSKAHLLLDLGRQNGRRDGEVCTAIACKEDLEVHKTRAASSHLTIARIAALKLALFGIFLLVESYISLSYKLNRRHFDVAECACPLRRLHIVNDL